jgi:hypothetical protein
MVLVPHHWCQLKEKVTCSWKPSLYKQNPPTWVKEEVRLGGRKLV